MKCIQCGTDNTLRDRTANQGRCKNCGRPFIFEPTRMGDIKFTDVFFANLINYISANNTLYFTPRQFYHLLYKKLRKKRKNFSNISVFLAIIFILIGLFNSGKNFSFSAIIVFISFFIGLIWVLAIESKNKRFTITQEQFDDWVSRCDIPKMLPSPAQESATTPVITDISNYGFDRVVVCDRPEIAQLLIANNFHFENNCAILSITGYPYSIFDTVMQMLRHNAKLKVYAFHDASPAGVSLVHRLRSSPTWFQNSTATIFDLGLLPRQLINSHKFFVQKSENSARMSQQLPEAIREQLSSKDLEWLDSGKFVELESFTPKKLIQVVSQGIAKSQAADSINNSDTIDRYGSDDYELTISFESFG